MATAVQAEMDEVKAEIKAVKVRNPDHPRLPGLELQLAELMKKENLLLQAASGGGGAGAGEAGEAATGPETAIHMSVNGKVQKLAIPFKPRVDLNALATQYNIEVQGFAIQPCSTTTPPDAYQPVEDLTPSIRPTETLWIKAKKRNGGNWFVNLFLGPPQPQPYVRAY